MTSATLLYDSDCGFCRWSLGKVLAWDRRRALRPVAIDSPEGDRLLAGMSRDQRMSSWHLVDGEGQLRSAGAAFPPLLRLLPGGRPLAAVAKSAPGLTDRSYRWLAGHRSLWGKLVTDSAKRRADRRITERASPRPRPGAARGSRI